MILGIDIGTSVTKAALMEQGRLTWSGRTKTQAKPDLAVTRILDLMNAEKNPRPDALRKVIVTGWGQDKVSKQYATAPLLNCIGRGAVWSDATCRTLLCMGAQQSVAVSLDGKGQVLGYWRNDKCASGVGKFLEIICEALECDVSDTAVLAQQADKRLKMSNQCAVFAESEVVSLVNDGEATANIIDAILTALTKNIATLCKKVKKKETFMVSGGLANNSRIIQMLEQALGIELKVFSPEPDCIAAIGAAVSGNGGRS